MNRTFLILLVICQLGFLSSQQLSATSWQEKSNSVVPDSVALPQSPDVTQASQKIRFQFQETDWNEVIPWFAEQAGYSLQPINDWPEGTFYLKDDSEYTTMEALDQLNHALRMRDPAFTLIRNRKMLILTRLENTNFPNELIETVKPEDLDSRGKYETVSCIFDLGELDVEVMYEELKPMVGSSNQDYFAVFPAANQIHVRETGGTLRDIRDLIKKANQRLIGDNQALQVYRLKHVDAETFMLIARGLLKMEPGRDFTEDGSLTISREPFGDRLFVRGTDKMLKLFDETTAVVDVAQETEGDIEIAKLSFKTYSIMVDPKLGFDLLQTVLEGTPARMQQDEVTGNITILGRDEDHLAVDAALASVAGEGGESFEIIKLENGDASDIMLAVQSLLRQTATAETTTGPVVMANPLLNQILVRGKPQEVREVTRMVNDLDKNSLPEITGPRTSTRIIDLSPTEMDALSPSLLQDLLGQSGRPNVLNVVLPNERKDLNSRLRGLPQKPDAEQELEELEEWGRGSGAEMPNDGRERLERDSDDGDSNEAIDRNSRGSNERPASLWSSQLFIVANLLGWSPALQTGLLTAPGKFNFQDETPAGRTTGEDELPKPPSYRPVDEVPSVPGAPIDAKFSEYGIVLRSLDLDALDDLEQAIRSRMGDSSESELPTFFFLQYRTAENMKPFLEQFFGLADSSGGGGGAGGLMGGMMNNMLGGGAGDLLGGLLGGGGGTTAGAGAGILEGDVRFGMDVSFNALYAAGATAGDLDQISQLIELLDQPDPPHKPDTMGEFRTIKLKYRDPEKLMATIESMIPDYIDKGDSEGGAQQNNEAQNMMKMLQQLQGNGKGGAAAEEQKPPKSRLGFDPDMKLLLVTGPDFIFQKISLIVADLDVPDDSDPLDIAMLERQGNFDLLVERLKMQFPGDIEVVGAEEEDEDGGNNPAAATRTSNSPGAEQAERAQRQQIDQARDAFRNMMQQQQRGGQQGGGQRGQGGGRGNGGGGNRGGGNGGGNGGGGNGGGGNGGGGNGGGGNGGGGRGN